MTVDKEQAAADYEALRLKDAEKLAQRKKKFDENRFAHIEKQNKLHGPPSQQPPPQQLETPLPPVTFEESNGGDKNTNKNNEKKGWRIFKKKNTPASTTELIKEGGAPSTTESTQARAHGPEVAVTVDLRDADFKPKNVPVPVAPNWAMREPKETPPHVGHSSDRNFSGPKSKAALTAAAQTQTKPPQQTPTTTPYQYDPSQPRTYTTVGYGATGNTTTVTTKKEKNTVAKTMAAFQKNQPKLYTGPPRNMQNEQVVSTTSEAMDNRGTITRTITRTITDPRTGQTRTETNEIIV